MVRMTSFLLLLSLAVLAHNSSARKCSLKGPWINDLGSTMNISDVDNNGGFTGTYLTAVSSSTNEIRESPLTGTQNNNNNHEPTFGFTVNWRFSESTTVFTGQCFLDKKGKEVLKTMWLLRSSVDGIDDDWKATRVGINIFTRPKKQRM